MTTTTLLRIPLAQLQESPLNPRKHYDQEALQQLADSLTASGQITPITVRPARNGKGGYEIAAGHRRSRAAALAGLTELEAKVREDLRDDDAAFIEILNVENLQRDDLHPLEEAQGFRTLMEKAGYDIPKIAARIGKSTKYVYDRIKLLQLIPEAQQLFLDGRFEAGHAILLARLSPKDQARAIGDPDDRHNFADNRIGGLFQPEHIEAATDTELELNDPRKAVSVREFQGWIDRTVRFRPEEMDPVLFPETATTLTQAIQEKEKVVKITREYRVPDEARDEKERTYGSNSWKRADGVAEEPDYGGDRQPGTPCDYSVVGLVVAGRGRGEAFKVCIAKKKCAVHWAQEQKEAARRAREAERDNKAGAAPKPVKVDPDVLPSELQEKWEREELAARAKSLVVPALKAVIAELKIADEICWNFATNTLYLDSWNPVGKVGYSRRGGTRFEQELEPLIASHLPGKFDRSILDPKDGPGARTALAFKVWVARDADGFDAAIDKAVEGRWKAHRAAEKKAAPPAQTSAKSAGKAKAKGKKLAGDVRRAKKKKAAK